MYLNCLLFLKNSLFCLTFKRFNSLNVIHADPATLSIIRAMIQQFWPGKQKRLGNANYKRVERIQSKQDHQYGVHSLKFVANPFLPITSNKDEINTRRVCCAILGALKQNPWELIVNADLSMLQHLITTWFFQHNPSLLATVLNSLF